MFGDVELVDNDDVAAGVRVHVSRGYISLYPFLFNLVADNERVKHVMDMLQDPDQLWS